MIHFVLPWIFFALPLPWVVHFILKPAPPHQAALIVPFFHRLTTYNTQKTHHSQRLHSVTAWLIWILLCITCAQPEWLGPPQPVQLSGRNIFIAVDISGSMATPDMAQNHQRTSRLHVVKEEALRFIKNRPADRIGLILFGSRPYLRTPLTFDHQTVKYFLHTAQVGLAGQQTAIGDAIGLGIKYLRHAPENNRTLILLTDGANNAGTLAPLQAAKLATLAQVKIYTIGLGAQRMLIQTPLGERIINPSSDLDTKTLKSIAQHTGGAFFRAYDTQDLHRVYKEINQREPSSNRQSIYQPKTPLYQWPLSAALLLSIIFSLCYLPFHTKKEDAV